MKRRFTLRLVVFAFLLFSVNRVNSQEKVACIGDSITEGVGTSNPSTQAYPIQLGALLGSGFTINNFGVSGTTMLKAGDSPYWNQSAFTNAMTSNPDIVTIALGTNDSKLYNWTVNGSSYVADYKDMIDVFQSLSSNPKIYVCLPPKAFSSAFEISELNMASDIRPAILEIAKQRKVNVIDLFNATENASANFPDGVHPDDAGATILATKIKEILTKTVGSITQTGDVLTAPIAEAYQWYINNEPISSADGGNNSAITAYATGNYSVSLKLAADKEDRLLTNPFSINAVLPLTFVAFTASNENNTVNLKWETANEVNNSHFNVLHSTDGTAWAVLDRIAAKGLEKNIYTYRHLQPAAGNNYYKLQQVDFDNHSTDSEIRAVDFTIQNSVIKVYPNPITETLIIQLPYQLKEKNYTIYNIAGVKLKQGSITTTYNRIDVSKLLQGMYFLKIDGETSVRLIKQ